MNRRDLLRTLPRATAGLALVTSTAGCLGGSDEYDVGMMSNRFVPESVEVQAGEEVVWKNTGSRNHTVTAYEDLIPDDAAYFASGGFTSEQEARDAWGNQIDGGGDIRPGDVYTHTFEIPGTYGYLCIPHEPAGMTGRVVVTE